jgi:hypothetical protein
MTIYGVLRKDVMEITDSMYAVTPDLKDEIKPLQFFMPDKIDWDAWRSSPGLDGDHDRFLAGYKATLKRNRKDATAFLLFSSSSEIILVSSSILVLETLEKLVGWLKLDDWGGEYVEKKEIPLQPTPLPINQDCLLYEYHTVVELKNNGLRGTLLTCAPDHDDEGNTWYSAIVAVDGINKVFLVSDLSIVSFSQEIVDKRKALYKQHRPRYYKAGR